jgi:hypothetical protein
VTSGEGLLRDLLSACLRDPTPAAVEHDFLVQVDVVDVIDPFDELVLTSHDDHLQCGARPGLGPVFRRCS